MASLAEVKKTKPESFTYKGERFHRIQNLVDRVVWHGMDNNEIIYWKKTMIIEMYHDW
jgi:hypothetical protein